jgi:cytochrome b subunit of formate dehydrogenase
MTAIAILLLILTFICVYFTTLNRDYIYTFSFINLFVDAAWILYNYFDGSYFFAILWFIILILDHSNYKKLTE